MSTFIVTTEADNGDNANPIPGSLRQAILSADAVSGPSTIDFNIPSDSIAEFPLSTPSSVPAGITTGTDGDLWFVERSGNEVVQMNTSGVVIKQYLIPTPNSQPILITSGLNGNLWFTENAGDKVGEFAPSSTTLTTAITVPSDETVTEPYNLGTFPPGSTIPAGTVLRAGTITEYAVPTPNSGPWGITTGPDGALWFTENVHKLGRIDPVTGAITEYALPAGQLNVGGLTTGPDGNLRYADLSGVIGQVTTSGVVTTFDTDLTNGQPSESNGQPYTVKVGPDGALWFPERTGKIGRITVTGSTTAADEVVPSDAVTFTPTGVVYPAGTTIPAGSFLPEGTITEYTIPTAGSAPTDLTVGADSAIWFPEGIGKIGRLTPDGTFTEFVVPTSNSAPAAIATGSDGNIWFTEYLGDKIGTIGGPPTIVPSTPLPAITQPVTIDGTSQPGYTGTPVVVLDGASAGIGANGLSVNASNSTVTGLVINNFYNAAILLTGGGGDTIQGNYLGTDPSGNVASGGFEGTGISIQSSGNLIGGTSPGAGNLISGNADGIDIEGLGVMDNIVEGNRIGTNASGTAAVGNGFGVFIAGGEYTRFNSIGGGSPGAGNLISGNDCGIGIYDQATNNVVQGNVIGTDVTGSVPLANAEGIIINDSTANGIQSNVISGNTQDGIHLTDASFNEVFGNLIGTDTTGTRPVPNGEAGILLWNASESNVIGYVLGQGNTIAYNGTPGTSGSGGVVVEGTGTVDNSIRGNSIYDNEGLGIDLGGDGVTLNGSHTGQAGPNDWQTFPILTSKCNPMGPSLTSLATGRTSATGATAVPQPARRSILQEGLRSTARATCSSPTAGTM